MAKLGGKNTDTIEIWNAAVRGTPFKAAFPFGTGHDGIYSDMVDALENNRRPYIDARAGRSAVELILAIYKSQKEDRPVPLPLSDFATADMKGAL